MSKNNFTSLLSISVCLTAGLSAHANSDLACLPTKPSADLKCVKILVPDELYFGTGDRSAAGKAVIVRAGKANQEYTVNVIFDSGGISKVSSEIEGRSVRGVKIDLDWAQGQFLGSKGANIDSSLGLFDARLSYGGKLSLNCGSALDLKRAAICNSTDDSSSSSTLTKNDFNVCSYDKSKIQVTFSKNKQIASLAADNGDKAKVNTSKIIGYYKKEQLDQIAKSNDNDSITLGLQEMIAKLDITEATIYGTNVHNSLTVMKGKKGLAISYPAPISYKGSELNCK